MEIFFNGTMMHVTIEHAHIEIEADCQVRNELGIPGLDRPLHERKQVVHAMTGNRYDKIPYMPRMCPEGTWTLGIPREKPVEDEYLWPYYIPIDDAWQYVNEWELDEGGGYANPTERRVIDLGYGIHYHEGRTTLGCIHVMHKLAQYGLVAMVQSELAKGRKNTIEVKYD